MRVLEGEEIPVKERYGVHVMGISDFVNTMKRSNITDDNIEEQKDSFAIISIIGDDYSGMEHYFKKSHSNVLNIEFCDVNDDIIRDGKEYKTISREQAEQIIRFIELNKNKNFIIHCYAGISRSAAVGQFMTDFYPWTDKTTFRYQYGNKIVPNVEVTKKLKEEWMRIHSKLNEEEYLEMLKKNKNEENT